MKHKVEESLSVYLCVSQRDDGQLEWSIDPVTIDGDPLFSNYENGPSMGGCDCDGQAPECQKLAKDAGDLSLPTAAELSVMLATAVIEQGHEQATALLRDQATMVRDQLTSLLASSH